MSASISSSRGDGYFDADFATATPTAFGKLRASLGIGEKCGQSDFAAVSKNEHPVTGERLRERSSAIAWHSVVISVPKSVSIVWLHDERVEAWFHEAVRHVIPFIESQVWVRQQAGGRVRRRRSDGGAVLVPFFHRASRELEPNLHAHVVVPNLTCDEGHWRAIDAYELFRVQRLIDHCVAAHLAASLMRAGYEVKATACLFEVQGLGGAQSAFGSRRHTILHALPHDVDPKKRRAATNRIAIETRRRKLGEAEQLVRSKSWQELRDDQRADLESCMRAAAERAKGEITPPIIHPKLSFAATLAHFFSRRWCGSDVDLIAAAMARHWGAAQSVDFWASELKAARLKAAPGNGRVFMMARISSALARVKEQQLLTLGIRDVADLSLFDRCRDLLVVVEGRYDEAWANQRRWKSERLLNLIDRTAVQTRVRLGQVVLFLMRNPSWWDPARLAAALGFAKECGARGVAAVLPNGDPTESKARELLENQMEPAVLPPGPGAARCTAFQIKSAHPTAVAEVVEAPTDVWPELVADRCARSGADHRKPCVVFHSRDEADDFSQRVRIALKQRGKLVGDSWEITTLRPIKIHRTLNEIGDLAGVILEFQEPVGGFGRGSRVTVLERFQMHDLLVRDMDGVVHRIETPFVDSVAVFTERKLEIQVGDFIRLMQPARRYCDRRLGTRRAYRVEELNRKTGRLLLDGGAKLDVGVGHISYAYASGIENRITNRPAFYAAADLANCDLLGSNLKNDSLRVTVLASDAGAVATRLGFTLTRVRYVDEALGFAAPSLPVPPKPELAATPIRGGHESRETLKPLPPASPPVLAPIKNRTPLPPRPPEGPEAEI